jgi:hypothetical protein
VNWLFAVPAKKAAAVCAFVVLNRAHEIEFNLLNPYLIVPTSPQFIFDHDGKRVPQGHGEVVITSNFVSAQCVNDN